jgi:hypothetical protein
MLIMKSVPNWTFNLHKFSQIFPRFVSICFVWKSVFWRWSSPGPLSRAERWSSEALFSGAVVSLQPCRQLIKGCHIRGPPAGSVRWAYVDWRGKRMCHIGRVFPCMVYIDSNRRDSRI